MKVVLFCGGMGMRLRDYSAQIPKPLVEVGHRPVMWHLMKYYAHFGHKEFILCLGHGAAKIKEYFLNYNECTANDFVLSDGGKQIELLNTDIHDWTISFVDTGLQSNIGERLRAGQAASRRVTRCSSPTTPTACPTSTSTRTSRLPRPAA